MAMWLQAVYEEDMVHRNPGDASTLTGMEQPFGVTKAWVQREASAPTEGEWRWIELPGVSHGWTGPWCNHSKAVCESPSGAKAANIPREVSVVIEPLLLPVPVPGHDSFTRVLIGDLKPEVLALLLEDSAGDQICQVGLVV